jgi:hypothetical protein
LRANSIQRRRQRTACIQRLTWQPQWCGRVGLRGRGLVVVVVDTALVEAVSTLAASVTAAGQGLLGALDPMRALFKNRARMSSEGGNQNDFSIERGDSLFSVVFDAWETLAFLFSEFPLHLFGQNLYRVLNSDPRGAWHGWCHANWGIPSPNLRLW